MYRKIIIPQFPCKPNFSVPELDVFHYGEDVSWQSFHKNEVTLWERQGMVMPYNGDRWQKAVPEDLQTAAP